MNLPGIYIHLPFCKVHCAYCDFPLTTRLSLAQEYYACLHREIASRPAPAADTLYFGGGTPSLTPAPVLKNIHNKFQLVDHSEVTLEANPDDITADSLRDWHAAGITRLSIGIQSLEPEALKRALRQHTRDDSVTALRLAREAGFESVGVDLILGLPGQTKRGFIEGLCGLIQMRPQHFSLYFLEVHENTGLHRQLLAGKAQEMAEDEQLECYEAAVKLLNESGYVHYEVSNFALPGFESRHNLKYWSGAPYYGYGPGAASYHDSCRIQNIASVTEYIDAVRNDKSPAAMSSIEDPETRMRNTVIFGLRRREGVAIPEFERAFGASPLSLFPDGPDLVSDGFLEIVDRRLRLTHRGMLLSNDILSRIV